jgi:hypothetical protein
MKKIISLVIVSSFSGFIFGVVGVFLSSFNRNSEENLNRFRLPASFTWQGKHQRLFEVSIVSRNSLPDTEEQDLVLLGTIQGLQPIEGEVYYKWILPPGASLVSGELEDSVSGLSDPQKFLEREITIHGVSHESIEARLVILQVYTEEGGVRMGNTAVFSNRPDDISGVQAFQAKDSSTALPRHIHQ